MDDGTYTIMFTFGFYMLVVESGLKAVFSTQIFNKIFSKKAMLGQYVSKPLFSIGVGILLCWRSGFDVLSEITGTELTNIGVILTGLAVSRGSGGLSDFLARRRELKQALSSMEVETIKKNGNGKPSK